MKKLKVLPILLIIISILLENVFASEKQSKYFSDMQNTQWAIEATDNLYEYGIISGTSEKQFSPNKKLTKAELATMLYKMIPNNYDKTPTENHKIMLDNKEGTWYYEALQYMIDKGVIETEYYTYNVYPNNYITRGECFFSLWRFVNTFLYKKPGTTTITNYKDCKETPTRYVKSADYLLSLGYIKGNNNKELKANELLNRAEVASILYTIIQDNNSSYEKVIKDTEQEVKDYLNNHISDYEINLIAWVIGGTGRNGSKYPNEIGYGTHVEKKAVAWEILNRFDSSGYGMGKSVYHVISFPGQYGKYSSTYSYDKVSEETYNYVYETCIIWAREKLLGDSTGRIIPIGYRWHTGNGKHNSFYKSYEDFRAGRNALKFYSDDNGGYYK